MADAEDLKSSGDFSSCGFDSHPGHQFECQLRIALHRSGLGWQNSGKTRRFLRANLIQKPGTNSRIIGKIIESPYEKNFLRHFRFASCVR
jgi:hypothetical protein